MTPTHHTPRGIRRAAAALASLTPLQWHQLERLTDSGAWLAGHATVPAASTSAAAAAVAGLQRLVELGLADGAGSTPTDRWRVTTAGHELVMQTPGPHVTRQPRSVTASRRQRANTAQRAVSASRAC
jgi:hypothetical protein